jgi:hypothetical protein
MCLADLASATLVRPRGVEALVDALPARCTHAGAAEACDWTGTLGELKSHLERDCQAEPVACPFAGVGCEAKLVRRQLAEHKTRNAEAHAELAAAAIGTLASTVAQLERGQAQLREEAALARQVARGGVPRLIELGASDAASVPASCTCMLGLYELDPARVAHERAVWVQLDDPVRCISYLASRQQWCVQPLEYLGEDRSFMYKRGCASAAPHVSDVIWDVYDSDADTWQACPSLTATAWSEEPAGRSRAVAATLTLVGSELVEHAAEHGGSLQGPYRRDALCNGRFSYVKARSLRYVQLPVVVVHTFVHAARAGGQPRGGDVVCRARPAAPVPRVVRWEGCSARQGERLAARPQRRDAAGGGAGGRLAHLRRTQRVEGRGERGGRRAAARAERAGRLARMDGGGDRGARHAGPARAVGTGGTRRRRRLHTAAPADQPRRRARGAGAA